MTSKELANKVAWLATGTFVVGYVVGAAVGAWTAVRIFCS